MRTYSDLLERLKTLTPEQLQCQIVVMDRDELLGKSFDIETNENPLYSFMDERHNVFCEFEEDEAAEESDGEKILDANYPIVRLY